MKLKKLLESDAVVLACADIAALYIRLVIATSRITRDVDPLAEAVLSGERQAVLAFWHSRAFLLSAYKPKGRPMGVLNSPHRDGRFASEVVRRFGITSVAGSSNEGTIGGVRRIYEILQSGGNFSMTPDGPRGPARIAAPGIAIIAKRMGLPVVPVAMAARRAIRFKSWDRLVLPLPFGRLGLVVGAPTLAGDNEEEESYRQRIEAALDAATDHADDLLGLTGKARG